MNGSFSPAQRVIIISHGRPCEDSSWLNPTRCEYMNISMKAWLEKQLLRKRSQKKIKPWQFCASLSFRLARSRISIISRSKRRETSLLYRTAVRGFPGVRMNRYAGRKVPLKMLTLTLKIPAINRCLVRTAAENNTARMTVALAFIMERIDRRRLQTVFVCACACVCVWE